MKVSYSGLLFQHVELYIDYVEATFLNCCNAKKFAKERLFYIAHIFKELLGCEIGDCFKEHVCLTLELIDAAFLCKCEGPGYCEYANRVCEIENCLIKNGKRLSCLLAEALCLCEEEVRCKWLKHVDGTKNFVLTLAQCQAPFSIDYTTKKYCCLTQIFELGEYLDQCQ